MEFEFNTIKDSWVLFCNNYYLCLGLEEGLYAVPNVNVNVIDQIEVEWLYDNPNKLVKCIRVSVNCIGRSGLPIGLYRFMFRVHAYVKQLKQREELGHF